MFHPSEAVASFVASPPLPAPAGIQRQKRVLVTGLISRCRLSPWADSPAMSDSFSIRHSPSAFLFSLMSHHHGFRVCGTLSVPASPFHTCRRGTKTDKLFQKNFPFRIRWESSCRHALISVGVDGLQSRFHTPAAKTIITGEGCLGKTFRLPPWQNHDALQILRNPLEKVLSSRFPFSMSAQRLSIFSMLPPSK